MPPGRPRKSIQPNAPTLTSASRRTSKRLATLDSNDINGVPVTDAASSTTSSFKGVFVNPRHTASSRSSIGSNSPRSPFTRDNSVNLDSPSTTLTTPSESLNGSALSARTRSSTNIGKMSSGAKRSRNIVDISAEHNATANDAELARALQEEEYDTPDSKRQKVTSTSRRRSKLPLHISDSDEDDELSSPPSDLSLEDDSAEEPIFRARPRKRGVPLSRSVVEAASSGLNGAPSANRRGGARSKSLNIPSAAHSIASTSGLSVASDLDGLDSAIDASASIVDSDSDEFNDENNEDDDDDDDPIDMDVGIGGIAGNNNDGAIVPRAYRQRRRTNRAQRERYKLEKAHPEIKTMWDDLKALPKIVKEEAPQPSSITRRLKGFQLEGLNWMIKQEQTQWKGGLLGDEMGMGKTIQAVSLIMSDYPARQPTLVVVPPVALMQWTNEIQDYTDGKLKVLIYHGTNTKAKKMSVKELKTYDVIMISYSGLESIYRKEVKGWTRDDKIVKEDSAIHEIIFHRILLDEAHSIKSRTTGVAKACFALKGTYKWCLSGTPVQNRIGEFFSLLRFLCVQPFANYFCKACDCSALHWSVSADYRCTHCKHRALDHVSVFNQEILNPIISGETDAQRKEALSKLRLITDALMLRRMKRDQTASMELPPKEVILHNEFFGEIERDFNSSIMSNTGRQFDTYVSRGVMLNNYANIFGLIMQMRQVADHPDLLLKKHADPNQNVLVCNICDEPAEDAVRSRCKHEFCRACVKDFVRTCEASDATPDCPRCHIALSIDFDQPEIEQNEEVMKKSSIINRIKMENWTSSTKIEMLVYDLYKLRSNKQTLKSIVFSQFTSMLQLIEWRLRRAGFNTVMLDGSMTPAQRQKSIEYFMNNTDVEVFLVSLKAGGVALNLTEASRVFIVDPWWNPAAEWQSADRCHRIGQKRPCVITRLCVEDSVESRIVMLQEKKANMINGTVNNDEMAMDKLSPEDMQFLFRGS